jgi:hypothetical protein
VQVAFTRALIADGKDHLLDGDLLDELSTGVVPDADELPVLLALSDNGPQMTSRSTKAFLAGARIATHFGRPGTRRCSPTLRCSSARSSPAAARAPWPLPSR